MKRVFDFFIALIMLILLSPVFVIVALIVRVCLGSPVLFRQQRPGLQGKPIEVIKFRTMTDERDRSGNLLHAKDRVTPVGRIIRQLSLDELPQLFNVLRGEMSLVGPRPLLMEYMPLYNAEQARRHEVKPGITGWAQVNGRNSITWEEKFALDVWYVDHQSIWLDFKIIFLTLLKVLQRAQINKTEDGKGAVGMDPFRGSQKKQDEAKRNQTDGEMKV